MKHTKEQQKAQEFLFKIYSKAWADENFKRELIANPIETLNRFTGKAANFPNNKKLSVQDQTNNNHIYINIPAKPNLEDIELNEKQLEAIAGGGVKEFEEWWDDLVDEFTSWF